MATVNKAYVIVMRPSNTHVTGISWMGTHATHISHMGVARVWMDVGSRVKPNKALESNMAEVEYPSCTETVDLASHSKGKCQFHSYRHILFRTGNK